MTRENRKRGSGVPICSKGGNPTTTKMHCAAPDQSALEPETVRQGSNKQHRILAKQSH